MAEKSSSVEPVTNGHDVEDDESNAITMVDVLKEENELEEDANAVLGGSDPQNCTYPQGYVKRQAVYACLTCIPPKTDRSPGGMCLACSYSCHEGHELVELYTKRNFCCDCGNARFGGQKCSLEPVKEINVKNKYNQNFQGVYCTCNRPYPDPEDPVDDEMIQCIMCEDWYHGRHLGKGVTVPSDYSEMICESCMAEHPFLWNYTGLCVTNVASSEGEVNADAVTPLKSLSSISSEDSEAPCTPSTPLTTSTSKSFTDTPPAFSPRKDSDASSSSKGNTTECVLTATKALERRSGATFWPDGWRKHLCLCSKCQEKYEAEDIAYLIDSLDTVQSYEEHGKAKSVGGQGNTQYDQAMQALSQLDRTKQVEAIHGYNDMKDQLKEYLQKFAESRKVVREEDIREFFSQMARKRPRVEIPSFCR